MAGKRVSPADDREEALVKLDALLHAEGFRVPPGDLRSIYDILKASRPVASAKEHHFRRQSQA